MPISVPKEAASHPLEVEQVETLGPSRPERDDSTAGTGVRVSSHC